MTDEQLRERLRALDDLAYARQRKDLAKRSDVPVGMLDKIRDALVKNAASAKPSGTTTDIWPTPVDGEQLLNGLYTAFERFLVVAPDAITALALWVFHSHAH